jgi:hypothetical protein
VNAAAPLLCRTLERASYPVYAQVWDVLIERGKQMFFGSFFQKTTDFSLLQEK